MRTIQGKIDDNDLAFILERGFKPIFAKPCPISEGGKINPQETRFLMEDGQITSVFHVKPIYYEALDGSWRPMSEVAYGFGNKWINLKEDWDKKMTLNYLSWLLKRMEIVRGQLKIPTPFDFRIAGTPVIYPMQFVQIRKGQEIHFTTDTIYPDPHPESTTVDGITWSQRTVSWANMHDNAGSSASDNDSADNSWMGYHTATGTSNIWDALTRTVFLFDTSGIAAGATISAATQSFFIGNGANALVDTLGSQAWTMDTCNPASNTALNADGSDCNIARWGSSAVSSSFAMTSMTKNQYNDVALTVLTAVIKAGITKIGYRFTADINNSAPGWGSNLHAYIQGRFADYADTTSDPKLAVTYTVASGPANLKTWDGLAKASIKTFNNLAIASTKTWDGLA